MTTLYGCFFTQNSAYSTQHTSAYSTQHTSAYSTQYNFSHRLHFLWILGMFFCYDFEYHLHFDCLLFGTRLYLSISHVKVVCSRGFEFWKDEMNSLHIKLERTLTRMCGCLFLDHKIVGKHLETWQRCEQNLKFDIENEIKLHKCLLFLGGLIINFHLWNALYYR